MNILYISAKNRKHYRGVLHQAKFLQGDVVVLVGAKSGSYLVFKESKNIQDNLPLKTCSVALITERGSLLICSTPGRTAPMHHIVLFTLIGAHMASRVKKTTWHLDLRCAALEFITTV